MKVVLCYAHPDDELIWGWPWLLDPAVEKKVLIASCDARNPKRKWCARQPGAMEKVGRHCGVAEWHFLDNASEFYRLPSRPQNELRRWWEGAAAKLREVAADADAVATHNPWGEYGMLDHCLLHRLVIETLGQALWTTARYRTTTWPLGDSPPPQGQPIGEAVLDMAAHDAVKKIYQDHGCWTWDFPTPDRVQLIRGPI